MIKIHMGCGGSVYGVVQGIDGPQVGGTVMDWINVDANLDSEIKLRPGANDLVHGYPRMLECDFCKLPFPENFADYIYSHHSLEHVRIDEVVPTLREWYRVLKPSGQLFVNVPDLLWTARKIVEKNGDLLWSEGGERTGDWENGYTKLIFCVFGDQSNSTTQLHKTGFTESYLRKQTEEAGFRNISIVSIFDMGMGCLELGAYK